MRPDDKAIEKQLNNMEKKISSLHHSDYTYIKDNLKKMLWYNFLIGLSRGLGMAVGFTLLGALVIYILQKIVMLHLPGISHMINDIIELVKIYK